MNIRMFSKDVPLSIDKNEVLRYLGYGKNNPGDAALLAETCAAELSAAVHPRCVYAAFPIKTGPGGIELEGSSLRLTGLDIAEHLKGCRTAVLMAATLSGQADRMINGAAARDMTAGLVLDSCATAAIEQLCDDAEAEIRRQYPDSFFTARYSPGYGDLPLELQRDFLAVLDAPRKIGLCATETSILTPRKSVTAVFGIRDKPGGANKTGCENCRLKNNCAFRKRREYCGLSNPAE